MVAKNNKALRFTKTKQIVSLSNVFPANSRHAVHEKQRMRFASRRRAKDGPPSMCLPGRLFLQMGSSRHNLAVPGGNSADSVRRLQEQQGQFGSEAGSSREWRKGPY
jgi:hypothetical protein